MLVRMEAVDAWCWAHCSDCSVGVFLTRHTSTNTSRTQGVSAWRRREASRDGRLDAEVLRPEDKWQVRPGDDEAEAEKADELEVWRGTLCECDLSLDG